MRASLAVPTCPSPSRVKSATAEMFGGGGFPFGGGGFGGGFPGAEAAFGRQQKSDSTRYYKILGVDSNAAMQSSSEPIGSLR